jgi:hypothetical protein
LGGLLEESLVIFINQHERQRYFQALLGVGMGLCEQANCGGILQDRGERFGQSVSTATNHS